MAKSSKTSFAVGSSVNSSVGVFRKVSLPSGATAVVMKRSVYDDATRKADEKLRELSKRRRNEAA